jgi:predicted metal-binding membrane protein
MASSAADLTSRLLRRERRVLVGAILLLATFSWVFVLGGMGMQSMRPPFWALVLMWSVMMVAMMLPSATPAILLYANVRRSRQHDAEIAQPWVFLAGYVVVWLGFSIIAALAQVVLEQPVAALPGNLSQSALLLAAGVYQLSPIKSACADQCRAPAQFITRHWRPGVSGALRLGVLHGLYCVGCCWVLMALLFVGGTMNLLWVLALTALVAAEKLLPNGKLVQTVSGVGLMLWGGLRLAGLA